MLTLLEPSALWLLLTLPLIVLLYVVRQRRRQRVVSALFLWTEAKISARRRRRISPTWLLLLQLLLAALLALALAQPRLRLTGAPPRVFVVDASASMAAAGPRGARLEEAVAQADALLADAGQVAVVRAGLGARVVQPLTGEHARVRRALSKLVAADADAAVGEALELARTLAPGAEVHLFSDRAKPAGFRDVTEHAVGQTVPNLGISAFELAYGQLFVSVVNSSDAPKTVALRLSESGAEAGGVGDDGAGNSVAEVRTDLLVPAHGQANTSVPVASDVGLYQAQLEGLGGTGTEDALELDNEAFAGSYPLRVRFLGDAPALDRFVQALPNTVKAGADADVTLAVGQPGPLPAGNVIVFAPPETAPSYREIADWTRSDPLLRFADLGGTVVAPSSAPLPLPRADAEVLARTADLTPVLLRWRQAGRTVLYFAFNPAQSDLPRRPAFPIVLTNALSGFRREAQVPLGTALVGGGYLTQPGRVTVQGRTYTSAPLPAAESRLNVTAVSTSASTSAVSTNKAATTEATRDPALWLVAGALFLLVGEWLLWSGAPFTVRRPPPARRQGQPRL